jgi:hypothetical protein
MSAAQVELDEYFYPSTVVIIKTLLGFGDGESSRHPAVLTYFLDQKYQVRRAHSPSWLSPLACAALLAADVKHRSEHCGFAVASPTVHATGRAEKS